MYGFDGTRNGDAPDARALVRGERPAVSEATVVGFVERLFPIFDAYAARVQGKRGGDDAFVAEMAKRMVEVARSSPNVIHAETSSRKATSVSRKVKADVNVVLVEPGAEAGLYCVSRFHAVMDKVSLTTAYDDGRIEFVAHAAERMVERSEARDQAIRRLGRDLYDHAGLLALGARLWLTTSPDGVGDHNVMLPVSGGVVMGSLGRVTAPETRARGMKVTRQYHRDVWYDVPGLGLAPRFVHQPVERQVSCLFTGMTFIGDADMSPRKARVCGLLRDFVRRHPIVAVAGLAFTWPTVRRVTDALADGRRNLEAAYEELAALHRDPDMVRTFGRPNWTQVPPLPWEEEPGDVIEFVNVPVPRFRTREQVRAIAEEVEAGLVPGPQ